MSDEGGAIEVFSYGFSASDPGTGLGKSLAVGKYGSFVIDPETGMYSYTLNADLVSVQVFGAKDNAHVMFSAAGNMYNNDA